MTFDIIEMLPFRDKSKLLFVLPASAIGGAETKTFNLLRSLNVFTKILITHSSILDFYSELEIKKYAFEDFGCINPSVFSMKNILAYSRAIKKITDYEKPDIVLGIMHTGALFVTFANDLFFLKVPSVVTIEGNISAYFNSIGRGPTLKEQLLLKYCFSRAKSIIVPSEGIRHDLVNNFNVSGKKIKKIYNGIDVGSLFKYSKEKISLTKDCPWIITACRLNNQKDFVTLLKAFKIIREKTEAKLLIIGDGELKEEIIKLSIELSVNGDVIMPGFQKNPFKYISKGDVFVLSSFYEGFGNVIVEAMAFGIPVVSTNCPSGPEEIINDGENGFLVSVKDYEKMAEKCLSIITDDGLKKTLSKNAMKRAEDFSIDKMEKEYKDYLMGFTAR